MASHEPKFTPLQASIRNWLDWRTAVLISLGECEHVCLSCAAVCGGEDALDRMRACVRLNLDCATICAATAAVVLHGTEISKAIVYGQLRACAAVCGVGAELCASHARDYEYCRICADTCRNCQKNCNHMLAENSPVGLGG